MLDGEARVTGELPEFRVRVSLRAKRVRLTVTPQDGLVVVVPKRWRGDAAAVVATHERWARQALARTAEARALHAAGPSALLPDSVELRFVGQALPVRYLEPGDGPARAVTREGAVVVSGDGDPEARLRALQRWLSRCAHEVLPGRLEALAGQHGFAPARVRISSARSRWGSCSGRGTISLNRALLLLAPSLVDALMLHELAHLRVLDHSPRFHTLLRTLDPKAEQHRRELLHAGKRIPPWVGM